MPRLHVVLVEPEIPPNTGNIVRLCAATGSPLHLVHPLGFRTDDRSLKRAGIDCWAQVTVRHYESFDAALEASGHGPVFCFSARAPRPHTDIPFESGARLVFGSESRGLPPGLLERFAESCYRIPIWGEVRSLNLSNAVAVALYEGYRNLGAWR
ncbi:MAG: tRNA (cytidine(34)-2'-O)-methyltransferase [Deltaproteobacteria bacterium]|nr:tRNA (cytidine(34)-2'-O)-methyltransferase [Deltaproteobacteria bacterium]